MAGRIGRFKIERRLGSGTQGTVWLARDPDLGRRVAVKVLDHGGSDARATTAFRREARTLSRIQHPNIVSIYEAGRWQGRPFLVFEYLRGRLLGELLAEGGMPVDRAAELFEDLLAGMAEAHRRGVVHRDLKPANILVTDEGVPKVMDFGIARMLDAPMRRLKENSGSPRYMAPEYLREGRVGPPVDVFALGLIFYEMLTGQPAYPQKDTRAVLEALLAGPPPPPSSRIADLDERLDHLILKALEPDPEARYADAGDFLAALREARARRSPGEEEGGQGRGTLDFLLRRMQRKSDFPALAWSIRRINALAAGGDQDLSEISSLITRDFALTNKVLKAVNSAWYGRFSGRVGTVSRAVVVLGIQPIRALAASLIFFEHLQDRRRAASLRARASAALFSAVFAARLAPAGEPEAHEEFFLSGMLHRLGSLLVAYYLPDEAAGIAALEAQGMSPAQAQISTLGQTFEAIGQAVARNWNFPRELVASLAALPADGSRYGEQDRRRLAAGFAVEVADWLERGRDPKAREALLRRFGPALDLDGEGLDRILDGALQEFEALTSELRQGRDPDPFLRALSDPPVRSDARDGDTLEGMGPAAVLDDGEASPAPESLLTAGLQELTSLMVSEPPLSEICGVVLETIYRALGCGRVVLCLRDRNGACLQGRLAFGEGGMEAAARFRIPLAWHSDVFHAALKNGVDAYIEDSADPRLQDKLPDWYRRAGVAGSFLLFPVRIKGRPVGLIYADHPEPRGLAIQSQTLDLLKALRNQLVLAVQRAGER